MHVQQQCQDTPDFTVFNLWPRNSPDLDAVDYEIWAVMQRRVYQKQVHSVDELKRRLIDVCSAVLNSRFLTRLLTSDKEDFERVSVLKEDTLSTASELTMLILSISVIVSVTCLTVAFLITKSRQQRWQIHSRSFYKLVY